MDKNDYANNYFIEKYMFYIFVNMFKILTDLN